MTNKELARFIYEYPFTFLATFDAKSDIRIALHELAYDAMMQGAVTNKQYHQKFEALLDDHQDWAVPLAKGANRLIMIEEIEWPPPYPLIYDDDGIAAA